MEGEGEGMEGEGGNERRALRADKSGTWSQLLQHQCQFQELTMTLMRGTCGGGCLHVWQNTHLTKTTSCSTTYLDPFTHGQLKKELPKPHLRQ